MKALDTYTKEKLIKLLQEEMKHNAFLSQEYKRLCDIMKMETNQDYKILTMTEYILMLQGLDVTQKPLNGFEDDTFINKKWNPNALICTNYLEQEKKYISDVKKIKSIDVVRNAINKMLDEG